MSQKRGCESLVFHSFVCSMRIDIIHGPIKSWNEVSTRGFRSVNKISAMKGR